MKKSSSQLSLIDTVQDPRLVSSEGKKKSNCSMCSVTIILVESAARYLRQLNKDYRNIEFEKKLNSPETRIKSLSCCIKCVDRYILLEEYYWKIQERVKLLELAETAELSTGMS